MLDVVDRQVVIIGGGAVAARKAAALLAAGATRVRAISPDFNVQLPPVVEKVQKRYEPDDLNGAGLVFAATDVQEVNDAIVRDANARGVLVSRADVSSDVPGDFFTPARFQEGSVIVTVSTGSPALATLIRNGLARRFNPSWARMADAMQTLRPQIQQDKRFDLPQRAELFRALATDEAVDVLMKEGIEGLRLWIEDVIRRGGNAEHKMQNAE